MKPNNPNLSGGEKGLMCPVMFCSGMFRCAILPMFCSVVLCHALFCRVVFCHVRRGREAGYPGPSGIPGTTWGLAAVVCRVGLAGGSVLEI